MTPGGGVPLLPTCVLLLPGFAEAAHGRGRQAGRLGPEERRQGFRELARRHALAAHSHGSRSSMFLVRRRTIGADDHRQDRRGGADRVSIRRAAVANLGPAHLEGADARLDPPLGRVPVAHQAPPTLRVGEAGMGGEERVDLGLDRLRQHPPGALAQQLRMGPTRA